MNWFRQNPLLGGYLAILALGTLGAGWFLLGGKSAFDEAKLSLDETAAELNRLQTLAPYPSEANLRMMKLHAQDYGGALDKLKKELKQRVLPVTPMAPNEFQSRLRQASSALSEKARANKVKLPDNFYLGFDEFASALPDTAVAPWVGQQLAQMELLLSILVDAKIDALTSLHRTPLPEEPTGAAAATPTPTPGRRPAGSLPSGPDVIERSIVEMTFASTPAAARRVLNQIASAPQQFFILRTLHVQNEKEKGPPRAAPAGNENSPAAAATASLGAKNPASATLNFIVGTERLRTSAQIEIVRFTF